MNELENVINGLECCSKGDCADCDNCTYRGVKTDVPCESTLMRNALALLKAQEPEAVNAPKPDSDIGCWYDITHNYTLEQVVNALKAQEPRAMADTELEAIRKAPLILKPNVDAVPVVRCKDCKYSDVIYDTTLDTMPLKCLNIRYGGVMPDWYCEHGERRDEDG